MKHILFVVLFLSVCNLVNSQTPELILNELTEEELLVVIDSTENIELAKKASLLYLSIGKIKKDTIKIARGFDRLARLGSANLNLQYADSIIRFTHHLNNITYPGQAYLIKAHNLKSINSVDAAIDNLIIAYYMATERGNVSHEAYAMHTLIHFKTYWGDPNEALSLQNKFDLRLKSPEFKQELAKSFRVKDERAINNYYESLLLESGLNKATCLIEIGEFDKAYEIINAKLSNFNPNLYPSVYLYLLEAKMESLYYSNRFNEVLTTIDEISEKKKQFYPTAELKNPNVLFFYGMTNYKMNKIGKAVNAFASADSIYNAKNNLYFAKHREMYPILVNHYKNEMKIDKQLYYLNQQLKMDSVIISSYLNVDPRIIDDFETPLLLAEKEKLIAQLEWEQGKEKRKQLFTVGLLFLSLGAGFYYFWKQNQYKKRFQALIKNGLEDQQELKTDQRRNDISAAIVEDILQKLERFESKHQFTRKDTSLQSVAKRFNTNSSYLSKVVNLKKDKNFSQYISELRIAYAVDQLKNNPRFRKYTIKAIAEEVGFGNAQSFSKAFYSRTGIQPSYFIRNLNKQKQNDFIADSIPQTE